MSQVLAVPNNLLIFMLHFFVITLYSFFRLNSPPASLMFTPMYLYAADPSSLSLHSSSVSKASSFRVFSYEDFRQFLILQQLLFVLFPGRHALSGTGMTSTVCCIACQFLLVLFRCINITCSTCCINISVPYCRWLLKCVVDWELLTILCSTTSSHLPHTLAYSGRIFDYFT